MSDKQSKLVRVPFGNELEEISRTTGMPKSAILNRAWIFYKTSKDYSNLLLFSKGD